jgi:hypothetical protein
VMIAAATWWASCCERVGSGNVISGKECGRLWMCLRPLEIFREPKLTEQGDSGFFASQQTPVQTNRGSMQYKLTRKGALVMTVHEQA